MKTTTLRKSLFIAFVLAALAAAFALREPAFAADPDPDHIDNGIPVVYLTIDESRGTIKDMNESPEHTAYCYGTVTIDVPDGFHYSDMPETACEGVAGQEMSIKGRGNSTWMASKKPYKLKLTSDDEDWEGADLLGLGVNKHWVLLANAYDRTLLKDRISGWLGDAVGMEFTPRGVPVDLVMRNTTGTYKKYLGSYYLSEQVRVGSGRVDIKKLKETDTELPKISGGYLVQGGVQTDDDSPSKFLTKSGYEWANHTPNFDPADDGYENDVQKDYIRGYMQDLEDAIVSGRFEGEGNYRDKMDLRSAALYWLIDQASKNGDGYGTGSTYLYKKRDKIVDGETVPGKMYWGPLWDFDFAWYYDAEYEDFELRHPWVTGMMLDKGEGGFVEAVRSAWPLVKEKLLDLAKDGGVIDGYYNETKASQAQDFIVNPPGKGDPKDYDYAAEIKKFKKWIRTRVDWMDRNMSLLDDMAYRVTYVANGETVNIEPVEKGIWVYGYAYPPDLEGKVFIGWKSDDGKMLNGDGRAVDRNMTFTAQYIPEEKATHATNLYFRNKNIVVTKDFPYMDYCLSHTVLPESAQDKRIYWHSSDDSVASVNSYGELKVHKPGEVIITATLKYTLTTKAVRLKIVDGALPPLTGVSVDKAVRKMKPGQYAHVDLTLKPANADALLYEFRTSNARVAKVDDNGVIHARKAGTAVITAEVSGYDGEDMVSRRAKCRVYVTGPNTIKVKGRSVPLKRSALKKKAKVIRRKRAVRVTAAKGKVTYTLKQVRRNGAAKAKFKKYFKVSKKTGKIRVRKGLKKGTYKLKIKVRAAGTKAAGTVIFKPAVKTATVTIRVR